MRLFIPLLLGLIHFGICAQEIPNGDFEEWMYDADSNLTAVGWEHHCEYALDEFDNAFTRCTGVFVDFGRWISRTVTVDQMPSTIGFNSWSLPVEGWETTNCGSGVSVVVPYCDLSLKVIAFLDGEVLDVSVYNWWESYSCPNASHCFDLENNAAICDSLTFAIEVDLGNGAISSVGFDDFQFIEPVGIEEYDSALVRSIYPNPSTDYLHVDVNATIGSYQIIDLAGRKVIEGKLTQRIDTSALAEGMYTMIVFANDGRIGSTNFVIQR